MKTLISLLTVAWLLVVGKVDANRQRSQWSSVTPFYKEKFAGKWFIYASYFGDFVPNIDTGDCLQFDVELTTDENAKITYTYKDIATKATSTAELEIAFDVPNEGHYTYNAPAGPSGDGAVQNTSIVAVEYDEYYIEVCRECGKGNSVAIYLRTPIASTIVEQKINKFLKTNDIKQEYVVYINQDVNECNF